MKYQTNNDNIDSIKTRAKYGTLILAIAIFVFLDLGVLVLNYYLSAQFQDDALNINLAGRQRMLSQKITKSLAVALKAHGENNKILLEDSYLEAYQASELFGRTLEAFAEGGVTKGADQRQVSLNAVDSELKSKYIDKALKIWKPFKAMLPIPKLISGTKLGKLSDYMVKHNLQLLQLMNAITVGLEKESSRRAEVLRGIQTVAMILVITNFVFILVHFIRQLRERDMAIVTYADGLLRHSESLQRQFRKEKEDMLAQLDSKDALVDDAEIQRRRRAVYTALKKYLNNEQLMQALWIWEEDGSRRLPRISMFPYIRIVIRKLNIKQDKDSMYMELTRCYAMAESRLDEDPLPQMLAWRSRRGGETLQESTQNSTLLSNLLNYIQTLDSYKAIELKRHILSLQSQLPLTDSEQAALREWLLANDHDAFPGIAHSQIDNIVGIVRNWAQVNFPPLVYQQINRLTV